MSVHFPLHFLRRTEQLVDGGTAPYGRVVHNEGMQVNPRVLGNHTHTVTLYSSLILVRTYSNKPRKKFVLGWRKRGMRRTQEETKVYAYDIVASIVRAAYVLGILLYIISILYITSYILCTGSCPQIVARCCRPRIRDATTA